MRSAAQTNKIRTQPPLKEWLNPSYRSQWRKFTGVYEEKIYTDEEAAFMMAMDRYKRENRRPFPNCREVLLVALALGYRKAVEAAASCP